MPTETIKRNKHVIDATGKVFGRLATEVAGLLRGKGKINFKPYLDVGDFVNVTNIERVKFTGKKSDTKILYKHSGYPGGLTQITLGDSFSKNSAKTFEKAVRGMLPKNKLAKNWIKRLSFNSNVDAH